MHVYLLQTRTHLYGTPVRPLGPSGYQWGEELQLSSKLLAYTIVTVLTVSVVAGLGTARITGIDEDTAVQGGSTLVRGCDCHNPLESMQVQAVMRGMPVNYALDDENTTYTLTVGIAGNLVSEMGGFNLHVSDGILGVPEGEEQFVQVTDLGDATHTALGVQQHFWNVTWTQPTETDEPVLFRLIVNSVNGNGLPDSGDLWARAWFISAGEDEVALGAPEHALHIETLGVNWLAYWVGIVSFVFMGVVLILYYFVFRYSETSKATDHRARKKK